MNKKFSTLVGCLLLGTVFSVNAQNLPKWYTAPQADFADPVVADFTGGKVERFDLSSVTAPGSNGRYVFNNSLKDVVKGMSVAFDYDGTANVAPGKKATVASDWQNVTTPVYGDFDGGLGIVPSMNNKGEVLMVVSTMGLSNPTNFEFDIFAAKSGEAPNRTINWTISAKAYDMLGAASTPADLTLTGITAAGIQVAPGTAIDYTANNAGILAKSNLTIRLNEAENGGANSLSNKIIIFKITNAAASVADGGDESQNKREPVTVIKDISFDYQRPEVLFSQTSGIESFETPVTFGTFNAGAGYIAEDDLYTRVEFYNPSTALVNAANLGLGAISVYKLDVKYPFVLSAADIAIAFKVEPNGDVVSYYFEMTTALFPVDPVYDGTNQKKKYVTSSFKFQFAPQEVNKFNLSEYIQGSVTAVNTSFADAKLAGNSVPSFVITPAVLAFDEYNQTQSADISVSNLPKYGAGEWIVNQTKNSMKPLQPYCEVANPAFKGFKNGVLVDNVANADFATEFLDATGNLKNPKYDNIKVYIEYNRGNVSTELDQSVDFQEVFRLNEALAYTSPKGAAFSYTGKNLVGNKQNAIYPNDLKVTGNNQYVWFSYGSNGSVAEAMGLPDGEEFNGHYERFFYAPFEANAPENERTSRVDTIFIHTAHLVPNADNKAVIKFAIRPNGTPQASNDFRYKAADSYGMDVAYLLDPVSGDKIPANKNFRGGANTDTLYYVIDLNNEAMVKAVKTKGLELNMKYIADTENWSENLYNGAEQQLFTVNTADQKGDNLLWVRGLTDRGVTTNIYAQDYKDWFGWSGLGGIFDDQFRNNYGTHYINTCVAADSSSFIVAGINLIDPVKITLTSNQAKSFIYAQNEVSKDYGTFDPKTMTITPNKYGEIYAKIDVKFAPADNKTADSRILKEKKYTKEVLRKFIYDNIALTTKPRADHYATKFYGKGALIHQTVDTLFNQRDKMGLNIVENGYNTNPETNPAFVSYLFEDNGFDYQADEIYSVIYGDAKKPSVKFVDENGVVIDKLNFGKIYFGEKADQTIYMIGNELPFEDLTWPVDIASTINFANSNLTIYPTVSGANAEYTIFDKSDVLGQETKVPVKVEVIPAVGDPCNNKANLTVNVPVLCNVTKTIEASFVQALGAPAAKAFKPGDIQGDRANLLWTPQFKVTEVEHDVTIGIRAYNKKSSSIFMSEVYSNGSKMLVELFNGTATQLNPDIFSEASPNYYLEVKENGALLNKKSVIAVTDKDKEILAPYGCIAVEFVHAFKANTLYTVTLMQGEIAMDQFQFSTSATHMGRLSDLIKAGEPVTEAADPYRQGKYDQAQWTNTNTWNMGLESGVVNFAETLDYNQTSSHPDAFISKWDAAKSSMGGLYDGTLIRGLHRNVTYSVWITPKLLNGMDCVKNVDVLKVKVATSDSQLNGGNVISDIIFGYPTGNEGIESDATTVKVIASKGSVTILNAAGKKVSISNILGQTTAQKLTSDSEKITVPTGIVVVAVEGEEAVKAVVK